MDKLKFLTALAVLFLITGCQSSFGPRALERTHPAYNQAIRNSVEQEMLLNLVRLKYRDGTYFLQISSVTASLSLEARAGFNASVNLGVGDDVISPSTGVTYADRPTISFTPLQGEDFLKSVLTPVSLEAVLILIQSGWSVERVFGLCIERMNDLYNAPRASGPTPEEEPSFRDFKRMLALFREFQRKGDLEIGPEFDVNTQSTHLVMLFEREHIDQETLDELSAILRGKRDGRTDRRTRDRVRISTNFIDRKDDQLTVRTRSIASLLHYLSQNIDVPQVHRDAGLVTITRREDGSEFDWSETPAGSVFKIRSSRDEPLNASVAVPYRGYWFYIADDDLDSKSTFLLLMQLFSLQAGQTETVSPTLTIPVGR